MDKKTLIIIALAVIVVFLFGVLLFGDSQSKQNTDKPSVAAAVNKEAIPVTFYRSPSCGCCGNYLSALKRQGFRINDIKVDDIESIKNKYHIPKELESCHTISLGNYVIEGHVPFEAIDKLLLEKPDIKGLALAGMPSGSPGMMGGKLEPLQVHAMGHNGEDLGVFMEL